ncbi:ATP-binding protein [Microbulbifer yueqingensis]|uniref:histidine kinase n=1 Tax=Microbulbifer yueqingensis TaxID=658219 RepID=A0A1G8X0X8_9GAMM|nr:ATP-binding protein [Microbulbifer yueqingensis]SDJ84094.1 Signal transduction histidine kinase [Microbulbifer yueqingensis]
MSPEVTDYPLPALPEEKGASTHADLMEHQVAHIRQLLGEVACGLWEWQPSSGEVRIAGDIWELFGENGKTAFLSLWECDQLVPVHGADREKLRAARNRVAATGEAFDITVRAFASDGRQLWLRWWGRSIGTGGPEGSGEGARGVIGGCADFTDPLTMRDQSEVQGERALWTLAAIGDGLWEWDLLADEVVMDRACWKMLGYEGAESGSDARSALKLWKSRILPEDLARAERAFHDHVTEQLPLDVEYRLWHRDGGVIWVRCRGQLQKDSEGSPVRVLGLAQDVTGHREAKARLERELESQRKESKVRAELLLSLSHELRTPLNAILGYSQMVELEMSLNPDQRQRLGEIRRAGQHLLHLVGDVLELARIDSQRLAPSMEPIKPAALVEDCKRLLEPLAETRKVTIIFEPLGWEAAYICADPVRFKQVVLNLAGNAVKYNRENGRVVINFSPQAEGWLRLSILDTGKGIAENRRVEVFEPFNRLGAERGQIEGTGVGLAIAKRLTEAMGGRIDFDSHEDQGSIFWIDFPLIDAPPEVMQMPSRAEAPAKLPACRVMLVNNRFSELERVQAMLSKSPQVQFTAASDAVEAIFLARTRGIDAVLFDEGMPGMSAEDMKRILWEDPLTASIAFIQVAQPGEGPSPDSLPPAFDLVQLARKLDRELAPAAGEGRLTKDRQAEQ